MRHTDMRSAIAGVLARALIARRAARSISTTISDKDLFPGAQGTCDRCGDIVEWRELHAHTPEGDILDRHKIAFWGDCSCWHTNVTHQRDLVHAGVEANAGRLVERVQVDIRDIQHFAFETFDTSAIEDGAKIVRAAQRWLQSIDGKPNGSYHEGPPVALYFHSAGRGRGKTHLACAMLMEAFRQERLIAFADEIGFIDRYWAAPLEARDSLTTLPGRSAWLTVLDDIGTRENRPPSLRDAWHAIFDKRWLRRGWTIITSNYTPDQLAEQETIDEPTYSRLIQMTGGKVVTFVGEDYRLREARRAA